MVIIYSTPACVYCRIAKEFFQRKGVEYIEKNVAADEEARVEMVEKSHQLGVPVIDIDGEIHVGFDRIELERALGLRE